MKKILAILTAIAAISMLVLTVSADPAAKTGTNEITIYAPKDGDIGGQIQITTDGTAALAGQSSTKGLVVPKDGDANTLGIVAIGVKAGDAIAVLTFTGKGSVTVTGLADDLTGALGTFDVGADDAAIVTTPAASDATTAAPSGGNDTDNTKTGVVIAIAPMALAAAAAAFSKKK